MLDAHLQKHLQRPLTALGRGLSAWSIQANTVTLIGFFAGLAAIPCLATQHYGWALGLICFNRFCDGLDGAMARLQGPTDFGGYLDIVCDFIFYAGVVWGMSLARPQEAGWAALLLFSFMGTASSFLAYAILAAKQGQGKPKGKSQDKPQALPKAFYYLGGLTEGTETIALLVFFCLFPQWFVPASLVFSLMCWVTTLTRVLGARRLLAVEQESMERSPQFKDPKGKIEKQGVES